MPKSTAARSVQILLTLLPIFTLFATAQQPLAGTTLNLVAPNGKGRIIIPAASNEIQWQTVNLYDQGTRPVFQMKNKSTDIAISYALFPNQTGSGSPNICRDDIVSAAIRSLALRPECPTLNR